MKTKIFTLLFAIVAGTTMARAATYSGTCGGEGDGSNLTWSLNTDDSTLTISGTGTMAHYNSSDHPWKTHTSSITSIILENGVASIDDWAFSNCTNVTSVSIPNTITLIGEHAFNSCSSLTSVTIPESVTSISYGGTFQYCTALQSVQWNAITCTLDPYATDADGTAHFYAPFGDLINLNSFTFGENVETIPSFLCDRIKSLTSVIIPESVQSLSYGGTFKNCTALQSVQWNAINCELKPCRIEADGKMKFYTPFGGLSNLTSFTFGENVETIPTFLCCGIKSLTSVTIPESVTSISYGATFQQCTALQSVQWYAINCKLDPYTIDAGGKRFFYPPFNDLNSLTSFTFGENVETIPTFLCCGIKSLTSVTIPESVTSISYGGTFKDCTALQSVYWNAINSTIEVCNRLEDGLEQWDSPFNNLSNITSFTFGENVESIPACLCYGLSGLTSITIPESVTYIGAAAFRCCSGLISVTIPKNVKSSGGSGFRDCTNLKFVQWNATNCVINKSGNGLYYPPFRDLSSINQFTFGENVEAITAYLCVGCSGLPSIEIPESVTNIGEYAFKNCSGFTFIVSHAIIPPALGDSVFLNVNKSIPLYVPCEAVKAYKAADQWKEFNIQECGSVSITIPEVCADDNNLDIQMAFAEGSPAAYSVAFDAKAVAQGFLPTYEGTLGARSSAADIYIPLPNDPSDPRQYVRPDVYTLDLTLTYDNGITYTVAAQPFTVHYPSWLILQRWNDLLSLRNEDYNGGYTFSAIRWFHEGMPVESRGGQGAYISVTPNLAYGEAYWAELTRADDGVTMTTCPFYPVPMTDKTEAGDIIEPFATVTPTALSPNNMIVTVQTNLCGTYFIHSSDGNLLDRQPFCPPADDGTFTVDFSPYNIRSGMYMITFQGVEGTVITTKIIVEP